MMPALYSVKRDGVTVTNCDTEPVRTPGCIQPHGVLLVLRRVDLTVAQVSENCELWLGRAPAALLDAPIEAVLGGVDGETLRRFVADQPIERNPLHALTTTLQPTGRAVDVTIHGVDSDVLVELEPACPAEGAAIDSYSLVKRTTARLQAAPTVAAFCQILADDVFALTQLDRVMVYRFLPDGSGEVLAEAKRADLDAWLGLRYPADDVPAPARRIFEQIGVRPLPDADAEMMEMVPLGHPDTGKPLDMTHCALRGASVMYTEYLRNMGVAASLTMPLLREGELWGLIACHHLTARLFPSPMRAATELVGRVASLQLAYAEQREHTDYRARIDALHHALLVRAAQTGELARLVTNGASPAATGTTLRDAIRCDGVALRHHDRWTVVGRCPSEARLEELAAWLRETPEFATIDGPSRADRRHRPVLATDQLGARFAGAHTYPELASGLLAIPLARESATMILWFRGQVIETVRWAGNPNAKPTTPGPHGPRLTPRASFEIWREQSRGRAPPWTPVEIEAALELRYRVMDLVMAHAEQLAELNQELARSNAELDAFAYVASHDLKEPLRGIHQCAHYVLADAKANQPLGEKSRDRLEALLQLTTRLDGLLDALLHFARVGRLALEFEELELDAVLREAIELLGGRVLDLDVDLRIPRTLPSIRGDRLRVREIFANLLSNAIKYGDKPDRWVEVGYILHGEAPEFFRPELVPPELGERTIFYVRDNGLGIDPAHHERVFGLFKRLHPGEAFGGGTGVGLTITKKLVEQLGGRIWLDSAIGAGSTFYFTLGTDGSPDLEAPPEPHR